MKYQYEQKERFWRANPTGEYTCIVCGIATKTIRTHIERHKELSKLDIERKILESKYTGWNIDIDHWVQRYKDKLETKLSLSHQGLYMESYLRELGILRSSQIDQGLRAQIRERERLGDDYNKVKTKNMIETYLRTASPEKRFETILTRDLTVLKNKGHENLSEIVTTLKVIKFVKKRLSEAQPKPEEEPELVDKTPKE